MLQVRHLGEAAREYTVLSSYKIVTLIDILLGIFLVAVLANQVSCVAATITLRWL